MRAQGEAAGLCEVLPAGCITIGRAGEQLAPFAELAAAGVRLFTDDGNGVQDPLLMRRAMEYSLGLDIVARPALRGRRLTQGAVMHEGHCCSELGLPGWPAVAEELMVHRDIELCRLTGARIHLLHLSTARSVELVRAAKADGLPVTAEVTPHHLALTDEALRGVRPGVQGQPAAADGRRHRRDASRAGRRHDRRHRHRPRAAPGRGQGAPARRGAAGDARPGDRARRRLGRARHAARRIVAALSWKPAAIAGVADRHGGPIAAGAPANLVVFDPDERWQVLPAALASRSRNTPYVGVDLRGRVRHTVFRGAPVVNDGVAQR